MTFINANGNDRPLLRDLHDHVVLKVAHKWKDLGVQLLIPDQMEVLDIMKSDYPCDAVQCCKCVLKKWLDTTTNATWNQLITALRSPSVGLNYLAIQIENLMIVESIGEHAASSKSSRGSVCDRLTTIEDIEVEFAIMTNSIKQALIYNKTDVDSLIEQLCTISAVKNSNVPLFDEDVFKQIGSIDEFWKRLRKFWSVYDYDLLRFILKITKCEQAQKILEDFLSRIDPSAIEDVDLVLHCRIDQREGSLRHLLRIKINAEKCTYNIQQKVKKIVSKHYNLKKYTICFKGIKEGCIELLYNISKAVMSYLLQYQSDIDVLTEFSTHKIIGIYINEVDVINGKSFQEKIYYAIYNDQADELRRILKDEIDVNHPLDILGVILEDEGWRPLHYAAKYNSISCATLMIEKYSCYINITNEAGETPLQLAIRNDANDVVYLLIINHNQQTSHLSQREYQRAHQMIEQYEKEHPEIIRNKLNQDIVDFMLQIRKEGLTIKVRYGKVVLAGSSAAGKTSFFQLLMKRPHCQKHISTGLAETQQVTIAKAQIQLSTQSDNIEFKALNFNDEISQLRSRLHGKLHTEPSLHTNKPVPHTHESTRTRSLKSKVHVLTGVEADVASNSEIRKLPQQPIEDVWNILTFIDTGGQPQFISMLPAVNSTAMVTFVVHKMEGGADSLHNQVTVAHGNKQGKHSFKPYSIGQTNLDLLKALMSFTNNIFLKNNPFLDKVCCKVGNSATFLSFIGTHSDKVTKEDVSETDKIIKTVVFDAQLKHLWMQSIANYSCLIPINNTTAGQDDEDENASIIRSKLNQLLQEQSVYDVPIVWVLLELEIRKVCNDRKCSFITYAEILELCKEKQLSSDEEFIKNGLRFHHLFGVLLYFEEVEGLKNLVITDHQWLFDNLTKIVCHQYRDISDTAVYTDFVHKGIFHKTLLDKIDLGTENIKMVGINKKTFDLKISFLNLLKHLRIVAPLKETEEMCTFFMPSLLNSCNFSTNQLMFLQKLGTNSVSENNKSFNVTPLLIQFTKNTMPDTYGTFPRGVFCCLAVQLLHQNPDWRLQWSIDEEKVFDNLITFSMETGHFITLMDKILFLEVQVRHKKSVDPSTCSQIYDVLCRSLTVIGQNLQFHDFKLNFGFACECRKECHVTRYSANKKYCYCYFDQQTELTESHLLWFTKKNPLILQNDPKLQNVNINLKEIYYQFYSQLVTSLPMKDAIFKSKIVTLLPDDLKGNVESKPTAAEAATCFLDSMIKPAVESGHNEVFNNLLTTMETSDNINLNHLAQNIRKEIQKASRNKPVTGAGEVGQHHRASLTQQATATDSESQDVHQPVGASGQTRDSSRSKHHCNLL